jgi:fructose-1,6-bisphosphatase/inositol monophosphatase family enzyme
MSRELLELAQTTARAAGDLLLDRFGHVHAVETKTTPTDPVSDADRDTEELILSALQTQRPEDGILSEEGGREESRSGIRWIIDPLDGTVNYLFGVPVWAVSIAAADERGLLAGIVFDPCGDEMFSALRGAGADLNGDPIHVSDRSELAMALVGTGFSYDAEARAVQARRMPRVLPRVRDIRRAGSAALDLSWVACGRLDGFFEAPMKPWDRSAGEILISEAGGVVTSLDPPAGEDTGVIAAGPALHPALTELVLEE